MTVFKPQMPTNPLKTDFTPKLEKTSSKNKGQSLEHHLPLSLSSSRCPRHPHLLGGLCRGHQWQPRRLLGVRWVRCA